MSREAMWDHVRMAWAMLSRRTQGEVRAGRPRESAPPPAGDEPDTSKDGFAEEALPWLDAVYRFALRLSRGHTHAAEDLAQDTFLRAHRSWHTFRRGTNAKAWLFTICRNVHLQEVRKRRELLAADQRVDPIAEELVETAAFAGAPRDPETEFFGRLVDDEVVDAVDALPEAFREVLVLSDLGDLTYAEIAEVLDLPVGTVKSRLFRGRRLLQHALSDFAVRSGYVRERTQ